MIHTYYVQTNAVCHMKTYVMGSMIVVIAQTKRDAIVSKKPNLVSLFLFTIKYKMS